MAFIPVEVFFVVVVSFFMSFASSVISFHSGRRATRAGVYSEVSALPSVDGSAHWQGITLARNTAVSVGGGIAVVGGRAYGGNQGPPSRVQLSNLGV